MTSSYSTDILIIGGGIAGLWLLNRLHSEGYQAILLENNCLGHGQTIASQGIIHGGLKYALSGSLTTAANAIAAMPARWQDCLAGKGDVDLTGCQVLSNDYYMWSQASYRSRLKTFLGSKSLRGRIDAVDSTQSPAFFVQTEKKGSLYRLTDFVINTSSLLSTLSRRHRDKIFKIDSRNLSLSQDDTGTLCTIKPPANNSHGVDATKADTLSIRAGKTVLCAGQGNQQLLELAGISSPTMQTRPLKMVYVKKASLPSVYVHCIGDGFSLTPKLTLTTHQCQDGEAVWYLGGELAEGGVNRSDAQQIVAAQALLHDLFPWVDLSDAQWQCHAINRAEPKLSNQFRPDDAYFSNNKNILVTWPTKLTLAPSLADMLVKDFKDSGFIGCQHSNAIDLANKLGPVEIASPIWNS
ncbi:MAG: hypothetical protein COC19_01570 [SAR86 cluster bacterium]|uniref:FAD dependent oxidoreductase domain-containing protein n=1 Tax=SAR86 cluster bacterium TaxID=2030880 RepID=A0A2A4MTR0_9GAMM|nr:MAG: hypothetical protein COC19_01570 [SAR86 cluster bacterium]